MAQLQLSLFGPPQIAVDGEQVALNERKAVALLVYLALTGNAHSRDGLATLLWPESDQSRARSNLRYALWTLRKAIGNEWLKADRQTVALAEDSHLVVDATTFRRRFGTWRDHDHDDRLCAECLADLEEAVQLYQEDFLAGFTLDDSPQFDEWQFFEAESLRQELMTALDALVRHHSATGGHESAIKCARRRLSLDPLHEPAHRTLMELYAAAGQQAAALRQYEECVRVLGEELGTTPDEETEHLANTIRRRELPTTTAGKTKPTATEPEPHSAPESHLPTQATPFVGRRKELAQLAELLANPDCRLITIVGPGGMGKTRLALQAAGDVQASSADGAHWVSLVGVTSAELLPLAIMQALEAPVAGVASSRVELLQHVEGKSLLLILDNFEQIHEGPPLLQEILDAAPGLKALVTSRERLRLRGEWLISLMGLQHVDSGVSSSHPDEQDGLDDALSLLLQCAQRIRPDFSLDGDSLPAARRICQLVDGMPLAIEHATAWLRAAPLPAIADELSQGLDVLVSDLHDLPERHRSMQNVLDGSWLKLSDREKNTLRRLALFVGPFPLDAARTVAGASLLSLAGLCDTSWMKVDENGLYAMHELNRQFAAGKLESEHEAQAGETVDEVRVRFCHYYEDHLKEREFRLDAEWPQLWPQLENIWSAWSWATERADANLLIAMVQSVCYFANRRGIYQETQKQLQRALVALRSRLQTDTQDADICLAISHILTHQAQQTAGLQSLQHARALIQESQTMLERVPDSSRKARAVEIVTTIGGWISLSMGQYSAVAVNLKDALASPDTESRPDILFNLTYLSRLHGRRADADRYLRAWFEETHASPYSTMPLAIELACERGDIDEAERRLRHQNDQISSSAAYLTFSRYTTKHLVHHINSGHVGLLAGRYDEARYAYTTALEDGRVSKVTMASIRALHGLGNVALAEEDYELATGHFREAFELADRTARWRNVGMALIGMSRAALGLGRHRQARGHLTDGLRALAKTEADPIKLDLVAAMAELRVATGKQDAVDEFLQIALEHPAITWATRQRALDVLRRCGYDVSEADIEPSDEHFDIEPILAQIRLDLEA